MLYYLTQLIDPSLESSKSLMRESIPLIRSIVRALKTMQTMYAVAELLATAAAKMLQKIGFGSGAVSTNQSIVPDEPYPIDQNERSAPGTPVQSAPDYVLNALSIYRMARNAIPEKHAPEKQPNASSPMTTTVGKKGMQRRAILQDIPRDANESVQSLTDMESANSYSAYSEPPEEDEGKVELQLTFFSRHRSDWIG